MADKRYWNFNCCLAEDCAIGTNLATKLVLRVSGVVLRVPPTICFTIPSWRSMHGRNVDLFLVVEAMEVTLELWMHKIKQDYCRNGN